MLRRRFRPLGRDHGCKLALPEEERSLLRALPVQLEEALHQVEPGEVPPEHLRRLFPRAYATDDEAERSFSATSGPELLSSQANALSTLAATAGAKTLSEEQMGEWMTALTELRLALGTTLGVQDDDESVAQAPEAVGSDSEVIYWYLTALQSELIDVMEHWLPDAVPGADDAVPDDPWGDPLGGLRWDGTPQPGWPPAGG